MRSEIDWVCMGILLTPIALGIICVIGILIINCIEELEGKSDRNYITFESFISFYTINPDRWWTSRDDGVDYHISLHNWNNDVKLYFKPLDKWKYKRWKSEKYELAQKQKNIKDYQKVVECVKRDLEEFNRKNEQMIKKEAEKIYSTVHIIPELNYGLYTSQTIIDETHPPCSIRCNKTGNACVNCRGDKACMHRDILVFK